MSDTGMPGQSSPIHPADSTVLDEAEDVYYFESDHLALKGNQDYSQLLKTIVMLESQRMSAIKDLDKLHEMQNTALSEPIGFVEQLQRGQQMNFPRPQLVAELPDIRWEKYTSSTNLVNSTIHKHMTRQKKTTTSDGSSCGDSGYGSFQSFSLADQLTNSDPRSGLTVVRGRVKDDKRSSTFNQLWSVEEQKRLESLLIQYPPEEVEAKRWQKIATALGNRTLQQVASRVQKYFIKLAKAGLPIPGKVPHLSAYNRKASHRHHRFQKFYYQPSTFMSSHEPPVYMSDDDSSLSYGENSVDTDFISQAGDMDVSDEELVPESLRDTDEYQELIRLKQIRQQKLKTSGMCNTKHTGFKCDKCGCDPIVGIRWHCLDCPSESSVDFCEDCVDSTFDVGMHNSSHRLEALKEAGQQNHIDQDYTRFAQGHYNYLDPNYMPAT
ncbi:ZZ-type zinc finger-containing protein 3-like [Liolophura sinensis]|uniref:ZZ-type zinc finger-containing protein 3-like n=1 Tax=Liolophura sinensis TaxID=3198878 RepID=UPI0031595736